MQLFGQDEPAIAVVGMARRHESTPDGATPDRHDLESHAAALTAGLEVVWEAAERAGWPVAELSRGTTGLLVATCSHLADHVVVGIRQTLHLRTDNSLTSTTCASLPAAMRQACAALRRAGADRFLVVDATIDGDGVHVTALALTTIDDAVLDGDPVLAVVRTAARHRAWDRLPVSTTSPDSETTTSGPLPACLRASATVVPRLEDPEDEIGVLRQLLAARDEPVGTSPRPVEGRVSVMPAPTNRAALRDLVPGAGPTRAYQSRPSLTWAEAEFLERAGDLPILVPLSAGSRAGLRAAAERMAAVLRDVPQHDLPGIAAAAAHRRTALRWRAFAVGHDAEDLATQLARTARDVAAPADPEVNLVAVASTASGEWTSWVNDLAAEDDVIAHELSAWGDVLLQSERLWLPVSARTSSQITGAASLAALLVRFRRWGVVPAQISGDEASVLAGAVAAGRTARHVAVNHLLTQSLSDQRGRRSRTPDERPTTILRLGRSWPSSEAMDPLAPVAAAGRPGLLTVLGRLWQTGVQVRWDGVAGPASLSGRLAGRLPTYPWQSSDRGRPQGAAAPAGSPSSTVTPRW